MKFRTIIVWSVRLIIPTQKFNQGLFQLFAQFGKFMSSFHSVLFQFEFQFQQFPLQYLQLMTFYYVYFCDKFTFQEKP